jgi:hypothetical protein
MKALHRASIQACRPQHIGFLSQTAYPMSEYAVPFALVREQILNLLPLNLI